MIKLVSERARTGMTLTLLLLATGRGADNAVPDLRLTLAAIADTIFRPLYQDEIARASQKVFGAVFGKLVQEIRAGF